MKLKPGCAAEYKRRHDAIWPELLALFREAGVSDYSIFLDDETLTLFGVMKVANPAALAKLPEHPVMRRWWQAGADLMETHPDYRPVEKSLREVFHLP